MKAAVLSGIRQFKIQDLPSPQIAGETDVLIRIKMVGVCGSDVHYYSTGRIGSQVVNYPFIVGHEAAGIVEKVGKKVTRLKPGQRVAIDPAISCKKCDQCLSGRENTCRRLIFMGNPDEKQGALSEFIVHDERSCFPIGDQMTFEQAVLSEPLAIAVYAVRKSGLKPGANVAVIGAGPVGICVFHALRTFPTGNIYITDKIQQRLDFCKQLNPVWSGNPDQIDIVTEIRKREPFSLDLVYECSGDPLVFDQAVGLLKPGGTLAVIGIPETDRITLPVHELRRKEITLLNIRRQAGCTERALELLEAHRININSMATHHFSLEQTQAAFDLVADYRDGVIKAMITLS